MITRWTFYFDQDNLRSEVKDEAENLRIGQYIADNPKGLLRLCVSEGNDIYVNLSMVKCFACQIFTEQQLIEEKRLAQLKSDYEIEQLSSKKKDSNAA